MFEKVLLGVIVVSSSVAVCVLSIYCDKLTKKIIYERENNIPDYAFFNEKETKFEKENIKGIIFKSFLPQTINDNETTLINDQFCNGFEIEDYQDLNVSEAKLIKKIK